MKNIFNQRILKNKLCVITGGRTGIGYEIVNCFLNHSARVIVFGRKFNLLVRRFVHHYDYNRNLFIYECDIRNFESLRKTIKSIKKRFKRIDILINNAAVNFEIPAEKIMPNTLELSINSNLTGHFYLTILVGKEMIKQKGCKKIISITAYAGGKAYPGLSHIHACKAGLDALTRTLAIEWSRFGILVNAISPGPILTKNFIHAHTRLIRLLKKNDGKKIIEEIKKNELPLGKFIHKRDIANMALYLSSDLGNSITGQTIAVDGGVGINNSYFLNLLRKYDKRK